MLLLAGDTAARILRHNQDVDQTAIFKSVGVTVARVRSPDTLVMDLSRAFNQASSPAATHCDLNPYRYARVAMRDRRYRRWRCKRQCRAGRPRGNSASRRVNRHLEATGDYRRPRGSAFKGREPSRTFGRADRRITGDHRPGQGLICRKSILRGKLWGICVELGERLLSQADLILAFGASLNYWTTRNRELFAPSARILHCDRNSAAIGALTSADVGLVGDVAETAKALSQELAQRGFSAAGFRTQEIRREIDSFRLDDFQDQSNGRTVDPRTLMLKLDAILPRDRTVVIDSGHSMGWPIIYLSAPDAAGFVFSNDFMAVGLGLGTAFGAAIARPDRLTVCTPGDGGLMMSLGELETFVRYKIPALVIVMNDASYGAEVHLLKNVGLPGHGAFFRDNDFAAIASAMGAQGITVRDVTDLERLHPWLNERAGPMVVDCKVDPQLRGDWFSKVFAPGGWYQRMCGH